MVTTMASVKLVNGHHNHHHPLYHHRPHHHHLQMGSSPGSPEDSHARGLDYSLRRPTHGGGVLNGDVDSESASRDLSSPPQSPTESDTRDVQGLLETPTKKNKRKLSEPKKRADVGGVKRQCPSDAVHDLIGKVDQDSKSTAEDLSGKRGKKILNGHRKHLHKSKTSAAPTSQSSRSRNSGKRDTSPPSSPQSVRDLEGPAKEPSESPTPSTVPAGYLHPMFAGMPPSAFGYVPGLYFGGRPFPHSGLHSSFPSIPFHIQQSYLAVAAAAAAAAQSTSLPSPSPLSSLSTAVGFSSTASSSSLPGLSGGKAETTVSDSYRTNHPTSHPKASDSQPPPPPPSTPGRSGATRTSASTSSSSPSSSSSLLHPPAPLTTPHHLSSLHPPAFPHRPGGSRGLDALQQQQQQQQDNSDDDMDSDQSPEDLSLGGKMSRKHRKNYKNMTRERRVEANARERTRVHTISAAFDALRRAVPSYSYNQKLSKLAILRIACSYIMSLARLNDMDYTSASEHIGKPLSFADCVDMCTSTIQTEGRARRRH